MRDTLYVSSNCGACQELKEEARSQGIDLRALENIDCDSSPKKCDDARIDFAPTLITSNGKKVEGVDQILRALRKK